MLNETGDTQNNPLLDVISDEKVVIEDLNEEFYDACSIDTQSKTIDSEVPDVKNEDSEFYDPKASDMDEDPLSKRTELEKTLSDEELEQRRVKGVSLKEMGNSKFKDNSYKDALALYTEALDICPLKFSDERAKIYSNRALCHSRLGFTESALADCDEALKLNPDYLRCLIRRADLRESADRLTEALEDYQRILKLDPGNPKARAACTILPEKIAAQQEKMKSEMLSQLKQLGNLVLKPFGLSTDNFKVTKDPNSEGYSVSFQQSS